jgi:hypothetical protein
MWPGVRPAPASPAAIVRTSHACHPQCPRIPPSQSMRRVLPPPPPLLPCTLGAATCARRAPCTCLLLWRRSLCTLWAPACERRRGQVRMACTAVPWLQTPALPPCLMLGLAAKGLGVVCCWLPVLSVGQSAFNFLFCCDSVQLAMPPMLVRRAMLRPRPRRRLKGRLRLRQRLQRCWRKKKRGRTRRSSGGWRSRSGGARQRTSGGSSRRKNERSAGSGRGRRRRRGGSASRRTTRTSGDGSGSGGMSRRACASLSGWRRRKSGSGSSGCKPTSPCQERKVAGRARRPRGREMAAAGQCPAKPR